MPHHARPTPIRLAILAGLIPALLLIAPPAQTAPKPRAAHQGTLRAGEVGFYVRGHLAQGGYAIIQAPAQVVAVTYDGHYLPMDENQRFLIGFGRDAPRKQTFEGRMQTGEIVRAEFQIAKRNWKIEHLPSLRAKKTSPAASKKWLQRRKQEVKQVRAARAKSGTSTGWTQSFTWPVRGRLSGVFGSQRIYGDTPGSYHTGLDVAAPRGTPIYAPADGIVTLASQKPFLLEGRIVMLDHGGGLSSVYIHLDKVKVKKGQKIRRGQQIGTVGSTGRTTGPHLHWGMNWGKARLDPALFMNVAADRPEKKTRRRKKR